MEGGGERVAARAARFTDAQKEKQTEQGGCAFDEKSEVVDGDAVAALRRAFGTAPGTP